jgi:phospholipid/cholesterol/gamma-HCH transport system permease protein
VSYSYRYSHHRPPEMTPTETFPVVQRAGIRFFRKMTAIVRNLFAQIGTRGLFIRDTFRGFSEPGTFVPETLRQMKVIGVDSVPLAVLVAAFIGGVIALQTRYQLFEGVLLSVVGLATRQTIILEMGPLLTGLVLAGRVGARMTAEIGTMRVTEQIDALETLAYDPLAFLVVPRLIAATIMLPILTILADFIGVASGYAISVLATDMTSQDFLDGVRLAFGVFQIVYSLMKATLFGIAIAVVCTYEGYITTAGAEGVGRSTARAVVITSVTILVLDAITAALFAPFLQA